MDDDDPEDDSENKPVGCVREVEDPSSFGRLNYEALFKDRFKWSKVTDSFWRVDQI